MILEAAMIMLIWILNGLLKSMPLERYVKVMIHYAWWGPIGALCALPGIQHRTLPMLTPAVNADLCVGCGICADICPQGNITLTNGKAHCGDNCTQCLACVHFCPQQAVVLNRKPTPKAHQYHHPKVTVGDMKKNVISQSK